MIMTAQEILYKVRLQKGDPSYVIILSQLNGCPVKNIEEILTSASWSFHDGKWHWPKDIGDPRTSAKIMPKVEKNDLDFIRSQSVLGSKKKEVPVVAHKVSVIRAIKNVAVNKSEGKVEMSNKKKSERLTEEQKNDLLKFYKAHMKDGVTYEQVGKEFNCSVWQVGKIVRDAGIVPGTGRKVSKAGQIKATPVKPIEQTLFKSSRGVRMTNNLSDNVDRELTLKLRDSIDDSINKKMRELQDLYDLKNTLENQVRRQN